MGLFKGTIYSSSLKMNTGVNIIFPERSNDVDPLFEDRPKVLYLLHGLSGNEDEWTRFSKIEYYGKKYNFIIIMPRVDRSFYCNTRYRINYFDYIADELPEIMSRWLRIDNDRDNTFIAGESMGGYGAVKIGLSRPERYAGIGALSGVLDYDAFAKMIVSDQWPDMAPEEIDALYDDDTPMKLAEKAVKLKTKPKLIQLCGTEDFLYENNQNFRKHLQKIGYEHTYREGSGEHAWPYWDKAVQYVFMFFRDLDPDKTTLY
ncbi:MAG: prolyl oligopeptidase family serine peptidase [Erysipelotrichaceae bacterium]|nr:prolyl oligopeptidase family serine peptidase [Erysipelotrichaceae bacterium]